MTLQDQSTFLLTKCHMPFKSKHKHARMLGKENIVFLPKEHKDILRGERGTRYPLMCLTTQRTMGPSRHVLSQMVVGGSMSIHPPFDTNTLTQPNNNNSRSKFWRR
jgi:hypothetical protein